LRSEPDLIDKLLAGDRCRGQGDPPLPRQFLADAVDLARRYARIEKMVLGAVGVTYSPSSLAADLSPRGDAVKQGEALAAAEHSRLTLPAGPILDFEQLVESQGIKIIPRLFPSPAYAGGFFFDAELGPCILLHANASESTLRFSLAHVYAHFLADFDPYISTLCGIPSSATLEHRGEVRAHAMALEFLMPRQELESYRRAMGLKPGAAVPADLVRHLGVYFDLDAEVVLWRLLALGWIDAAGLDRMLERDAALAETLRTPPTLHSVLPERFVRLVAGAFGRGKIDLEAAAEYLDTNLDGAEGILAQFDFGAEEGMTPVSQASPARSRSPKAEKTPHSATTGGTAGRKGKGNGSGQGEAGPGGHGPPRLH
jgi:Zn-dependent peptidase ImmA (M78 family)